ncbi:MAG: glycosyltransferase [Methanomassiliicoccales archaeon]|nr:MAG: glycosyltransferase [Methanomassiliicoccales archaeon]
MREKIRAGKVLDFKIPDYLVDLKGLRVACILDDFTFTTFSKVCDAYQITSSSWRDELESFDPHMLFVEAAWHGKGDSWRRKISIISDELVQLLTWCSERNIPTVFWNKDDPPHYATFINTAALFDIVFTTDIDLIGDYKKGLGHDRVYLLPFWAEPSIHNPIEKYERIKGFCFAGTYYMKYLERRRDFKTFFDALSPLGPFDIYDRNEYAGNPNYTYPDEFKDFIKGTLPYDQIDVAYKGYFFGINMNSIKDSQLMCARRTYELMASNTIVLSNYSRAVKNIFGDLIIATDDGEILRSKVIDLLSDDNLRDSYRLRGLRRVLLDHTTENRLSYVVEKTFGKRVEPVMPSVTMVSFVKNKEMAESVTRLFLAQGYAKKQLVIVAEQGIDVPKVAVKVLTDPSPDRLREAIEGSDMLGIFDAGVMYGKNYLLDLCLAGKYADAEAYQKSADGEKEYSFSGTVHLERGLVKSTHAESFIHLSLSCKGPFQLNLKTLTIDRFLSEPCKYEGEPWDEGIPIRSIFSLAEQTKAGERRLVVKHGILVVAPHYPSYDNIYRYIFVHRRIKAYLSSGLKVEVFRFNRSLPKGFSEFDGVDVITGSSKEFDDIISQGDCRTVFVHFLNEEIWNSLKDRKIERIVVWVHGAEIQPWYRREFNYDNFAQRRKARIESDRRLRFWRHLLSDPPENVHFVFVSRYFFDEVCKDLGVRLDDEKYSIIHNYIDKKRFLFVEKGPEMRNRVLSVRPFSNRKYANDLSVKAILELSKRPCFKDMEFRMIGEGPLFDETVAPLRRFENVILENRSLSEAEYSRIFDDYGVFLCPTRWDSHGVSRDEAMSKGLVAITNNVAAIPEFVDESSAMIVPPEDYVAMADAMQRLYDDPDLFIKLSRRGPGVVEAKCGYEQTIARELELAVKNRAT